jgi:hypothetical protein
MRISQHKEIDMVCSSCGAPRESQARFCVRCGAGVVPPVQAYPPPAPLLLSRVDRHLRTLGMLWIAYGALPLAGWLIALPFLGGMFGGIGLMHLHRGWYGFHTMPFGALLIPFVTAILLLVSASSFLVGFGLLRRAPWGRGLAIGFAFWAIIHPPLGTALAIYTWWVLMPQTSAWGYQQIAA